MTLRRMLRPALVRVAVLSAGAALASCTGVDSDANRFEDMAQHVANIRLDGAPAGSGDASLFRPAIRSKPQPLTVQIMDPHDLWDARDGGLRGAVGQVGERVVEAASPAVAQVAMQRAVLRPSEPAPLRPAMAEAPAEALATIQLGAYSTPEAARMAWDRAASGPAGAALAGLSPVFEAVEVNGRSFTRLKIVAPAASAVAICQTAAASDPWCARRA